MAQSIYSLSFEEASLHNVPLAETGSTHSLVRILGALNKTPNEERSFIYDLGSQRTQYDPIVLQLAEILSATIL